jgi:hypothetical protein
LHDKLQQAPAREFSGLAVFPTAPQPAGDREQHDGNPHENQHLRLEVKDWLALLPLAEVAETLVEPIVLLAREAASELIEVTLTLALLRHQVGHRGHRDFLEGTDDHLGRNDVAAVLEQPDGGLSN